MYFIASLLAVGVHGNVGAGDPSSTSDDLTPGGRAAFHIRDLPTRSPQGSRARDPARRTLHRPGRRDDRQRGDAVDPRRPGGLRRGVGARDRRVHFLPPPGVLSPRAPPAPPPAPARAP